MPDTTPRLGLPWLMPAQARKHVTVNEALGRLDALTAAAVKSRTRADQPAAPAEGEAYILPDGAAGADWADFFPGDFAYFQDGAWARAAPRLGLLVHVEAEARFVVWTGAAWVDFTTLIDRLANLEALGVGTAPDSNNPFAAKLNSALWTARYTGEGGTGDLRYTLNKEGESATCSLLFQSGWSGRAELGLSGRDDFTVKVSPDGGSWSEALSVLKDGSGVQAAALGIGTAPGEKLDVDGDTLRLRRSRTPAGPDAPGAAGAICWDGDHLYVCVAQDTWKRAALTSWTA